MSAQANETLVRSLYSAFNARKFEEATKVASPKLEWRDVATGEIVRGPEGMRHFMERWANAFNDARVDVKRVTATEKTAVTEFVARGTNTGPLETSGGTLSPTNRRTEVAFCEVATIESGKIVSIATYYDSATILQQLGVTEPAGAGAHK